MNLRQLRYFVSVVEAGNMTRAAEQLHVAQTALGMQIRQIEEDSASRCLSAIRVASSRPRPAACCTPARSRS